MANSVVCLLLGCVQYLLMANGQSFDEKYRLQVHHSVPSGWSNDPNGLVFANGVYHLFYQHNPNDIKFGPISWGHAQSVDLVHWENLPIAIPPYEKGVIFSGCCVLDNDNFTGVAPDGFDDIPILAIYTVHKENATQSQAMAYSLDKGLTFTQYEGNPIIPNQGIPDFRDPNIFERNGQFYMVLAVYDRLQFFSSTNLLDWKYLSDFGVEPNEGDKSGVWECPSLITLRDEQGNEHDLLFLSMNGETRNGLIQYFIGKFNGTAFNSYDPTKVLRADNGFDNYAAIPYHNDPLGRIIWIGWLSNWLYAQVIPTSIWRGQMTVPRELALKTVDGNLHLVQQPIDTFNNIIDASRTWSLTTPTEINGQQSIDLTSQIPFKTNSMLTLEYAVDITNAAGQGSIALQFGNKLGEFVSFNFDIENGTYEFDRSQSGDISFSTKFADKTALTRRISDSNLLTGRIILDTASIEIFADDGLNTFSSIFFPTEIYENIKLIVDLKDSSVVVKTFSVAALNSIWTK